jgi:hypothetical protein
MSNLQMPQAFEPLKNYLVDTPQPILTKETIQVVLIREVLDYTIFRTEETREINKVLTPVSITCACNAHVVPYMAAPMLPLT